jgi:hemerythrin-like metal-binding protein
MYYSHFSTGNIQIDGEHANIDCMIDLCRHKEEEWTPSARLLVAALANHLDSEERICRAEGLNMTQEHVDEHKLLKIRLAAIEQQVQRGEIEKDAFLTTLRDVLFYHITNFDKQLKS